MKTILLIDDDPDMRLLLKELLQFMGYSALEGNNGAIGIRLAKDFVPDLIICDCHMPVIDGYGVITAIREHPETRQIPLIFFTNDDSEADRAHAMELGANLFLSKSAKNDEILAAIRQVA